MKTSRFRFAVEGSPVPKPRMTQRDRWEKRPEVIRYRAYADAVRAACIDTKRTIGLPDDYVIEDDVEVRIVFGRDYTLVEISPVIGKVIRPKGKPDIDNLAKSVMEGLSVQKSGVVSLVPILLVDDKQVASLLAEFEIQNRKMED